MKMAVTAEGVETEEQLKYLRDEGCDLNSRDLIGRATAIKSYATLTGNVIIPNKSIYCSGGRLEKASLAGLDF